jgi:ATP-dependent DNA ligase
MARLSGAARTACQIEKVHGRTHDHQVLLCAFDLLELDGVDLREAPLIERYGRAFPRLERRRARRLWFWH